MQISPHHHHTVVLKQQLVIQIDQYFNVKKTKELLPNYNKEVEDKLATTNVHQPSSSNNLDFTLLCNVNQHVKAKK